MAELTLSFHPIGTRAFVADLTSVRGVEVAEVILLMSSDRGKPRHVVKPTDGEGELTFDQYTFARVHPLRQDADAEFAANTKARKRLDAGR